MSNDDWKYRCVTADPPWAERGGGKCKRGADRHYPLMGVNDIIRTMMFSEPWGRVADDAHLWLWVTDNFLEQGLQVIAALGFQYIRTLVWVKTKDRTADGLQIGLGQYLRGSHELCLLASRGDAAVPEPHDRLPSVIFAPRTKHSRKPEESFALFERVSPGPRLEIFSRRPRDGWDVWGNEVSA